MTNKFIFLSIIVQFIFLSIRAQKKDSTLHFFHNPPTVTEHSITIKGNTITYKATTGYLTVKNEAGKEKAKIFYTAYTKNNSKDLSKRPLTFSFNGGPGSSSVWLHLGMLGPRKITFNDSGYASPPPYQLIENEYSWLDLTDLVFIDPVSTGYSRPVTGENKQQFHGYSNDIKSVGEFIRLYTTQNKRWNSPKYLIGESYGTTRASGLSNYLQNNYGYYLNGVMLLSMVLDFRTIRTSGENDLPYSMFFPTFTATALYHNKLAPELQEDFNQTIEKARDFTTNEYSIALFKGSLLSSDEKKQIAEKLSYYSGLPPETYLKNNLKITPENFRQYLLLEDSLTIGRFDSRYTMHNYNLTGSYPSRDASYVALKGPFSTCINYYYQNELNYNNDIVYQVLTGNVFPWKYPENSFLNVSGSLRAAMINNPHLKVWIMNGYLDLATPFFASEYTINQLNLEPKLKKNIKMTYYQAGHMMYVQKKSLVKLKQEAILFYKEK